MKFGNTNFLLEHIELKRTPSMNSAQKLITNSEVLLDSPDQKF